MDEAWIKRRLDAIIALLVLAVSCLAGLVFGRSYGGEAFFAVVVFVALSFVGLFVALLGR